jgi:geranylgeranyl pyrophosphate synthase
MTGGLASQLELTHIVDSGLAAIERAMNDVTDSQVDVLRDASRHILSAGGKRIRPRLLLLSYLAHGGTDIEYIARPAAAVELMHTASVVHDDINDHGILRRGRPSVNAIWGRTFALLTGDFLFTAVYELMAPYGELNVDLAKAATALVEGETLQASAVKNNTFFARSLYADHRLEDGRSIPCRKYHRRQTGRGGPIANQSAFRFRLQRRHGVSDRR